MGLPVSLHKLLFTIIRMSLLADVHESEVKSRVKFFFVAIFGFILGIF